MGKKSKIQKKLKRSARVRSKIMGTKSKPRLSVYRSNKYVYAQLINDEKGETIISVGGGSLGKAKSKGKSRVEVAKLLGEEIAKKAKLKKIKNVVFDRGSYKYHGRVKAVAEGARKGGLKL
jgi:large subunit ribosomal protein L18